MLQLKPKLEQCTQLSKDLTSHEHRGIIDVLHKNMDLFAWPPSDMSGITLVLPATSLPFVPRQNRYHKEKKKKMGEEWRKVVREEVDKLPNANFIREVKYSTWLSNFVMVKKANEKWQMCTDYTNLNRACPKDAYPLPNIDRLVDGASEFQVLSFLDAYFENNQIKMHTPNEEKMIFITEDVNFSYRVMPFNLKNASATYQRLMDRIFKQ